MRPQFIVAAYLMPKPIIYYDLKNSPIQASNGYYTLIFSSESHKAKFIKQYKENREKLRKVLKKKYGVNINLQQLADIILYRHLETRGFRIIYKGEVITCPEYIVLNGVLKISNC